MGWVKEIGWGLALNDRDADNPYQMNDAEMLLESCRQELIAVEALQKSNDRSLQEAENHVRSYQGRVASAQSTLKTIVTTSKKLEEALVDQRAVSNQIQQDVDYLLHQRTGLETMHQSMSDASAAGVAGLRIAYRKKFAVAIIKVLIATPMDEGISSQMDIILHILQTIPPNSQIYAEVLPTFKSVEDRIKAAKGVVV